MISLSTPNTISGRSAFIELLQSEGVTHLFGNPGTTELPIMHALADYPDMRYVLGLQEAIVVAMADGYARASGELVACNVHVAPGLGNAMGSLFTAFNSGTPLIVFGVEGDVIQAARRTRVGALRLRYPRGRDNARQAVGAPTPFAESDQ